MAEEESLRAIFSAVDNGLTAQMEQLASQARDLERTFDNLSASIERLPGVDIDADTSEVELADETLEGIRNTINAMPDLTVNTNTGEIEQAGSAIDRVKQSLYNVPTMEIEADTSSLQRAIQEVNASLQQLEGEEVEIEASTGSFSAKIHAAKSLLRSIPEFEIVRVYAITKQFNAAIKGMENNIHSFGQGVKQTVMGIAGSFAPAIIPAAATAGAAIGGLASAFAAAGAGAVGFGALAVSALGEVFEAHEEIGELRQELANTSDYEERIAIIQEMEMAMSGLSDKQVEATTALFEFTDGWNAFASQFEPQIIDIFIRSLEQLGTVIQQLEPAFQGAVTAVDNLSQSLGQAFNTEPVQRFVAMLNNNAGPMLQSFGQIAGNVMLGIMNLMVAFAPVGQIVVDKILQLSEAFANWSSTIQSNPAFQQFLSYVQENAPTVLSLIGELIQLGVNVVTALAPLGSVVLEIANGFLQWTNELIKNNKWIVQVGAIVGVLMTAFMALAPIILLISNTFGFLASLLSGVITALFGTTGAVSGLTGAAKIGATIVGALKTVFGLLGSAIKFVIPLVKGVGTFIAGLKAPVLIAIGIVIALATIVVTNWNKIWNGTQQIFTTVGNFLVTVWNGIKNFFTVTIPQIVQTIIRWFQQLPGRMMAIFTNVWTTVSTWATNMWNKAVEVGTNFVMTIVRWFQQLPSRIWNWLVQTYTRVTAWASNMWNKALEVGSRFVTNVLQWLNQLPSRIGYLLGSVIGTVASWVVNMGLKAYEAGSQFLSNVIQWFRQLPGRIWTWLQNTYTRVSTWASQMWNKAIEVGTNFISSIVQWFSQLPGRIASFFQNAYSRASTWASNMWNKAMEVGSNFLSAIVEWFSQIPGRIWNFLSNAYNRAATWASQMWSKAQEAGSRFLSAIIEWFSQLPGRIQTWLSNTISRLATWVSEMAAKGREAGSKLVNAVVEVVTELPGKMIELGKNVVRGFWDGITSLGDWLWGQVTGFFGGIIDGVLDKFGVASPSKVFKEIAKFVMQGFGIGIDQNGDKATSPVERTMQNVRDIAEGTKIKANPIDWTSAAMNTQVSFGGQLVNGNQSITSAIDHNLGQLTVGTQPAHINLHMGDRAFRGFTEDVNDEQGRIIELDENF